MGPVLDDPLTGLGSLPTCKTCGSGRVVKDAWACWNPATGLWELEATFDQEFCHQCEADTSFVWKPADAINNPIIRQLNDLLRVEGKGNGHILVTVGVRNRGAEFTFAAVSAVRRFADFDEDNNPWGEHDFGAVEVVGEKIFWKIDYYNPALTAGSENPANAGITKRVLTIMLASDY